MVWRHPRVVQQRARLPKADWGGRCIATEACNFTPAVGQGTQPLLANSKGGQAYNQEGCPDPNPTPTLTLTLTL